MQDNVGRLVKSRTKVGQIEKFGKKQDKQDIWKVCEAKQIFDHLNCIKPGIIHFTMEELLNDGIAVLDLRQKIDKDKGYLIFIEL